MKGIKTGLGALAALGALALGGSALAGAAPTTKPATPVAKHESAGPDHDGIQSQVGDQTTPDNPGAKSASESAGSENAPSDGPRGHADNPNNQNAQNGDQTTPDKKSESAGSEKASGNDGPGGYQGNSNADGQQEGQH